MSENLNDKLRSYQREALEWMKDKNRILECDDMGLGKTVITLADVNNKYPHGSYNFLIVCGKKSLYVWQSEIEKWLHQDCIIYHGTPKQRQKQWMKYLQSNCNYCITTYGMLDEISELTKGLLWSVIIADEIHESGLLNSKSKTWKSFEKFARDIHNVYLLTGTPIRQGVIDLYAPLHIIDRVRFNSYWQFVGRYCITLATPFGKEIERRPRNPEQFRQMLSNFMIRRTKAELCARGDLQDLPGKQRQVIHVEMNKKQQTAYDALVEDLIYADEDTTVITPNKMTLMMRLRQLLVCPRLLGIDDDGEALEIITSMAVDLMEDNQPFVVFTPFRQVLPFIRKKLEEAIKNIRIYEIHGGMDAKEFANQWQSFQQNSEKHKAMLCVIKSSSSFNAYTAAYSFFLGYEWDFNLNVQAEDRLCRLGQHNFVNNYYMMYKGTVDEDIAQRLNDKQDAANWAIGTQEQYNMLLKRFKVNVRDNK